MTTVTGTFQQPNGTPITSDVKFVRAVSPDVVNSVVTTGQPIYVPVNASGELVASAGSEDLGYALLSGYYLVYPWSDSRFLPIWVPDTTTVDVSSVVVPPFGCAPVPGAWPLRFRDGSIRYVVGLVVDGQPVLDFL